MGDKNPKKVLKQKKASDKAPAKSASVSATNAVKKPAK